MSQARTQIRSLSLLPRTNADKRRAVLKVLEDKESGRWSLRKIARRCGVSSSLVRTLRRDLAGKGRRAPRPQAAARPAGPPAGLAAASRGSGVISQTRTEGRQRVPEPTKTTIEWVRLSDLISDPRYYQRPFDPHWVEVRVEHFDPDGMGLLFVAEVLQGGEPKYVMIDGQHRAELARRALGDPHQRVQCEVIRGVTPARAAELWRVRNDRRRQRAIDDFLAEVKAGKPEAVEIDEAVRTVGLMISSAAGPGKVRAITPLRRIYTGDRVYGNGRNVEVLKQTLVLATEAWGAGTESYHGEVLLGLGLVLLRDGGVIEGTVLLHALARTDVPSLLRDAKALQGIMGIHTKAHAVAEKIVTLYNERKRKHLLQPWSKR